MNILPYQIHSILKIYREPPTQPEPVETGAPSKMEGLESDRVEITEEGRKEQIKREIVSEIVKKIR